MANISKIKIIQDKSKAIEVMFNVGSWMENSGMNPSIWFRPENMNPSFLSQYTEPSEYYVAIINNKPAASMILQTTERNQSWESVDGTNTKHAIYLHWLCVHRDFSGMNLSKTMVEYAMKYAKENGFTLLRLDTDADNPTLCSIYENLGFKLMGTEDGQEHRTAFYQIRVD
jgi:ribosomal protein S18 acetylase RimI-like enzyme